MCISENEWCCTAADTLISRRTPVISERVQHFSRCCGRVPSVSRLSANSTSGLWAYKQTQLCCTSLSLVLRQFFVFVCLSVSWITLKTRGKVLSWEYGSLRKRNSRPPASVILCWVSSSECITYLLCVKWFVCLFTLEKIPGRFTAFLDSNLHTRLAIVTENELGLAFPPRNLPKTFRPDPSTFYLVVVVTNKQTDRQTNAGDSIIPRFRGYKDCMNLRKSGRGAFLRFFMAEF